MEANVYPGLLHLAVRAPAAPCTALALLGRPRRFTPRVYRSLAVIGTAFIIVGVLVSGASADVVEQTLEYDSDFACASALSESPCASSGQTGEPANPLCWRELSDAQKAAVSNTCEKTIVVEKFMKKPVYFYYELDKFYQNQRVYVKSQAAKQLRGDKFSSSEEYTGYLKSQCVESGFDQCTSGELPVLDSLPPRFYCNPCGLVARSFFTDEFNLTDQHGAKVEWTQNNVAWPRDEEEKFKQTNEHNKFNIRSANENALVTDPDFIVWMRTAALPNFRKLHRIIDRDLYEGEQLTLTVYNNYDVSSFGGSKKVVLSTMSSIGGQNSFLGHVYIAVGALCVFLAVLFVAIDCIAKKKRKPM